jgi:iron complex transport system ATP-binding protein
MTAKLGLTVDRLSLTLGQNRVLDTVSMAFARGRVTVVLGPNGAGKSSLLDCLAGLRLPDAGTVRLDGIAIAALDRRTRAQRIGLLPQSADVHWNIDVATLVGLGRFPHQGRWGETPADREAVARAMTATDVTAYATRGVNHLSGGERGRVLLARLADEPLASLDPAHQLDVLDRLRGIAADGAGVIVVLHDLNQAARVADDILMLRAGKVVAFGPASDVLTEARIAETYGVATHIGRTADGRVFVIPVQRIG